MTVQRAIYLGRRNGYLALLGGLLLSLVVLKLIFNSSPVSKRLASGRGGLYPGLVARGQLGASLARLHRSTLTAGLALCCATFVLSRPGLRLQFALARGGLDRPGGWCWGFAAARRLPVGGGPRTGLCA